MEIEKNKKISGYINVWKEKGMTSHDVVYHIRKILQTKKVGHTGTLDPDAEGVLVCCVGKATKMVEYLIEHSKVYETEVILGMETDTCDLSGQVVERSDTIITREDFETVLRTFTGEILQKPPIYSAIRVNGKKLYEYARKGETVSIPTRRVVISEISVVDFSEVSQIAHIRIACSKGTYVRSLCRDIGKALGSVACMGSLLRHQVGDFTLGKALTLSAIAKKVDEQVFDFIYPLDYALKSYGVLHATEQGRKFMLNGNKLLEWNIEETLAFLTLGEIYALYDGARPVGMGTCCEDEEGIRYIKPVKLL